ncbi:MAG: nucleotidyltransferase [Aliifodinibius sp.]|nr:nucleotidyltransferase [Fodinibius sp.]
MTKNQILEILHNLKEDVSANYKAEIKGIFGSYAREEQNQNSDIDILVEFHKGATLLDLVRLGYFLEDRLQIKVDVVSQRSVRKEIEDDIYKDLVYV